MALTLRLLNLYYLYFGLPKAGINLVSHITGPVLVVRGKGSFPLLDLVTHTTLKTSDLFILFYRARKGLKLDAYP